MFTNYYLVLTLIVSVLITLNALQLIESASSDISHPVVYRRYVRRRPPIHLHDEYSEDIVEIFHTKEKPPAEGLTMTDEDVDKFIFCDFNRHLEMCKEYWNSRKSTRPLFTTTTTTIKPFVLTSTTAKSLTTASTSESAMTTVISGIPHLDVAEYLYSDENTEKEEHIDYNEEDKNAAEEEYNYYAEENGA